MPPSVYFMGDMLSLDERIEPSFMLNDGYDDGGMLDAFTSDPRVAFYRIDDEGTPHLIYESASGQFTQFHQSTSTFGFEIESLPMRVVTCLTYEIPTSGERRATLHGFNFDLPESELATFPITEAAAPLDLSVEEDFDCVPSAASYAGAHMQMS